MSEVDHKFLFEQNWHCLYRQSYVCEGRHVSKNTVECPDVSHAYCSINSRIFIASRRPMTHDQIREI
jgi:hypothetical protein